jgi:uncharacterized tellurite resistance protein B-like protein
MLKSLKTFMDAQIGSMRDDSKHPGNTERSYKFATAMLLLEMTRADFEVKEAELSAVSSAIQRGFELSDEDTRELLELAKSEIDQATSFYEFTRQINDELSNEKKRYIVELLWRVAYADGELDKYEDNFIRKIAELLHVRHSELIKAKHRVLAELD